MKWKDKRRNDEIDESETRFGIFRLSVHHYWNCEDQWFASCHYMFSQRPLESKKLDEAKGQAVAMVQVILEDALAAIKEEK